MSALLTQAKARLMLDKTKTKSWTGISSTQIEYFLSDLMPLLRRIDYDTLTLDSMLHYVTQRSLQLWVYGPFEGVLVTEIVHHPQYTVLSLRYGAGKFSGDGLKAAERLCYHGQSDMVARRSRLPDVPAGQNFSSLNPRSRFIEETSDGRQQW